MKCQSVLLSVLLSLSMSSLALAADDKKSDKKAADPTVPTSTAAPAAPVTPAAAPATPTKAAEIEKPKSKEVEKPKVEKEAEKPKSKEVEKPKAEKAAEKPKADKDAEKAKEKEAALAAQREKDAGKDAEKAAAKEKSAQKDAEKAAAREKSVQKDAEKAAAKEADKTKEKEKPAATPAATPAASNETLIDLATKHGYQSAWASMFKGEWSIPSWLQYLEANSAPVIETTGIDGNTYVLGSMCKGSDCANDRLIAIFSADHKKCWGLEITVPAGLGKDGERHPKKYATLKFYGNPDVGMKKVLMAFLDKDPSWK